MMIWDFQKYNDKSFTDLPDKSVSFYIAVRTSQDTIPEKNKEGADGEPDEEKHLGEGECLEPAVPAD